jgi:hypothetical protein
MKTLTIYGQTIKIELGNGSEIILDTRYKVGDSWEYILAPSIFLDQITTKAKTDELFENAIAEINAALEKAFGKVITEPEPGLERVRWLVQGLTVQGDKIVNSKV